MTGPLSRILKVLKVTYFIIWCFYRFGFFVVWMMLLKLLVVSLLILEIIGILPCFLWWIMFGKFYSFKILSRVAASEFCRIYEAPILPGWYEKLTQ